MSLEDFSTKAELVEHTQEESTGPSIEDADILVTGGRGLGGPEGFKPLEELASALGGAVASTRAVVDSGWYPYPTQIGQTGKVVSPKVYIGFGVSGAIQHKVGMQTSQTIIAINKDGNAPIFEFSDLGVVGDLNAIVPQLTALVKERKGKLTPGGTVSRDPGHIRARIVLARRAMLDERVADRRPFVRGRKAAAP